MPMIYHISANRTKTPQGCITQNQQRYWKNYRIRMVRE